LHLVERRRAERRAVGLEIAPVEFLDRFGQAFDHLAECHSNIVARGCNRLDLGCHQFASSICHPGRAMSSPRAIVPFFRRAVSLAVAAAAVSALVACSGGGGKSSKAVNTKASSQKVNVPGAQVTLRLASIDVQSAGPAVTLDDKTKVSVMTQTRRYVEEAVVRPLLSGNPAKVSYSQLFGPTVSRAATHAPDSGALTDVGIGKVTGDVRAPATNVAMHALVGTDGFVQYIATDFDLHLTSTLSKTPLRINRNTELTFEKAPSGKWIVTAYRVITTRSSGASAATTKTSKTTATKTTGKP
jgi:hypothetical protein